MTILANRMSLHHRECDALFAQADNAATSGDWAAARAAFDAFRNDLGAHFRVEEETIFPRFEAITGIVNGPTRMMRAEHAEMRAALERLEAAIAQQDAEEFAGESETLLILMQQHNLKEESVLYPMCDHHLVGEIDVIARKVAVQLGEVH